MTLAPIVEALLWSLAVVAALAVLWALAALLVMWLLSALARGLDRLRADGEQDDRDGEAP